MSLIPLTEDRRLKILEALAEVDDYRLSEGGLVSVMQHYALMGDPDLVRADLIFLERHQLIRLEKLNSGRGEVWVAILTEDGSRVARGREHPGIKRAGPR